MLTKKDPLRTPNLIQLTKSVTRSATAIANEPKPKTKTVSKPFSVTRKFLSIKDKVPTDLQERQANFVVHQSPNWEALQRIVGMGTN